MGGRGIGQGARGEQARGKRAQGRRALAASRLGALLTALLGLASLPAQAQTDWFRPPADVGQPTPRSAPQPQRQQPTRQQQQQTRQQPQPRQTQPPAQQPRQQVQNRQAPPAPARGWSPFQPLIDLFRGDEPPRVAAPRIPREVAPAAAPVARTPVIEAPAEPRGTVYASAADAREGEKKLSEIVLVAGDEFAAPLAQGLADAFAADREGVAVVGKSEAGSGLGPGSPFDWLAAARQLPGTAQAKVTVLFVGANDLVPIEDPMGRAEPLDERWRDLYGRRLDDVMLGFKLAGRPVVVVGQPPVEDDDLNERRSRFNDLVKERVERAGLKFVDVTDGFVDENGKFITSGPAVDGQRRRLRSADGLGFTRAGGRKLAFFVDRELDDLLAKPGESPAAAAANPADARPSIILLTGGAVSGARTLAGAPGSTVPGGAPAAMPAVADGAGETARVLVSGAALPAVAGRTDDFHWPANPPADAAPSAGAAPADPASAGPVPAGPVPAGPVPADAAPAAASTAPAASAAAP